MADDIAPAERVLDAARSIASGASPAAVARWFDVPESQLQELIAQTGDQEAVASAVVEEEQAQLPGESQRPRAPFPSSDRESGKPSSPGRRTAPARSTPAVHSSSRAMGTTRRPSSSPSAMGFRDSLQLLRRRLLVLAALLVLGATAGWVTAPGATRRATTFKATHTAFYVAAGSYNLDQVALLATSGEVPSRVAARLKMDRGQVRDAVTTAVSAEVGTISITGRSSAADEAVALAEVTSEELAAEVDEGVQVSYQTELARLTAHLTTARSHLNSAKNPADQSAARGEIDAAQKALDQYQATGAPKSQFQTLEKASATAASVPGVKTPQSKPIRAALLGGVGLLIGIAAAFALHRIDGRIRSKTTAEEAFSAPVIAEVPKIGKSLQGQLLARTQPSSPFVEAYRGLRTYVALWAPDTGEDDGHRVIVVTSPSPGEGKTTTVAHLAAMLAEIGRSVLVVSADLRRPRIHQYFDRSGAPGLVDVLAGASNAPAFDDLDLSTAIRGVRLVPSGPPVDNPALLLEHAGDLLHAARGMADFVLVDCPPLLVANDAVDLARHADGVLLVARSGETPIDAAEHCAELLDRLEIPVVGTVLVASESASSASRYYASRYYAEPERTGVLRRRTTGTNGHATGALVGSAPDEASRAADNQ